MNWELWIIIWVLCAGLCYFVARDRSPSSVGLATALGFFLGPLGVLLTFLVFPKQTIPTEESPTNYATNSTREKGSHIAIRNGVKLYKDGDHYKARGITFNDIKQFEDWAEKQ